MSEIHAFKDTHLDRPVIIKCLQDGQEHRRLLDEQKALLQLRSKHVVQLYDIVEYTLPDSSSKGVGLVLEHVQGQDLHNLGTIESNQIMKVIWQISCGLNDIHQADVIHRDIKPQNIMLDSNLVVKIIDFGLSRDEGHEAKTAGAVGTLFYMAPELFGTSTLSFSKAIDIYAFAVTVLALTKRPTLNNFKNFPHTPVAKSDLDTYSDIFSDSLIRLLVKCLSPAPLQRPHSDEIEQFLRNELTKGQHRGELILNNHSRITINHEEPIAGIKLGETASVRIKYNGYHFFVSKFVGEVLLNNSPIKNGDIFPESCLITLKKGIGSKPQFVTFDISKPEVLI